MAEDRLAGLQTIRLKELVLELRIGQFAPEFGRTQKVRVSLEAWRAAGPFTSDKFADCLDYHRIYRHLTEDWPERPHLRLLESWAELLVAFILEDPRIEGCRVRLEKLEVYDGKAVPEVEFLRYRQPASTA